MKIKENAGLLNPGDAERWQHIKDVFRKNNRLSGIDADNQSVQVISQLMEFNENFGNTRSHQFERRKRELHIKTPFNKRKKNLPGNSKI